MMDSRSDPKTFDKVSVFVVRGFGAAAEILTFLHPSAGRQIPAGSVEDRETPLEAARREVIEETGFDGLTSLTVLGEKMEILEGEAVALAEVVLHDEAGAEADRIQRGHRVRIERKHGGRLLARRRVYDLNVVPPLELPARSGWADARRFGTRIRRSFFLARAHDDGRRSWVQLADGHAFRVEWHLLDHRLTLVPGQAEWLARYYTALMDELKESR